jgi:hypothetical protein
MTDDQEKELLSWLNNFATIVVPESLLPQFGVSVCCPYFPSDMVDAGRYLAGTTLGMRSGQIWLSKNP